MEQNNSKTTEFKEKLVNLAKVTKVVKGGRNYSWSALVVVGDENGQVGCGLGKASEVSEAIRKGVEDAKKNLINISIVGTTIPHEITGEYGAARVLLKPAPEGTGIIAGGTMRAILEMAGIKNIRAKCLRSTNPTNVVKATFAALEQLRTAEEVAQMRGKSVDEIV